MFLLRNVKKINAFLVKTKHLIWSSEEVVIFWGDFFMEKKKFFHSLEALVPKLF